MTAKADSAIQNLSELEEILTSQKNGDVATLKEVALKVKQFKESLIKELDNTNQSKSVEPVIESNIKHKNLSGSVLEVLNKVYKGK